MGINSIMDCHCSKIIELRSWIFAVILTSTQNVLWLKSHDYRAIVVWCWCGDVYLCDWLLSSPPLALIRQFPQSQWKSPVAWCLPARRYAPSPRSYSTLWTSLAPPVERNSSPHRCVCVCVTSIWPFRASVFRNDTKQFRPHQQYSDDVVDHG